MHSDRFGDAHTESNSSLMFHEDGRLSVDTTCNTGTGRWAYGLDERDLTLSEVSYSQATCSDSTALLDAHIRQVITDGTIHVTFGSARLFVTRGGIGITAVAR